MKNKFFTIILAAVASLFAATASAQVYYKTTFESICLSGDWGDQPMTPFSTDSTENHVWYTVATFDDDHKEFWFKEAGTSGVVWGTFDTDTTYLKGNAFRNWGDYIYVNKFKASGRFLIIFNDNSDYYKLVPLNDYAKSVSIKVENPGELSSLLQQQITNTSDVYELTISGTLNEQDKSKLSSLSSYSNLAILDLSGTNITTVPYWQYMDNFHIVKLPETVTSVEDNAFRSCSSLTCVNLPGVTSIGNNAFYNCGSLQTINMPNVTSIEDYAFYQCDLLQTINMPNVTSIEDYAFSQCYVRELYLSENLNFIGRHAFERCILDEVHCPKEEPIVTDAFRYASSFSLYVPASSLDLYMEHNSWNMFSSYICLSDSISLFTLNGGFALWARDKYSDKVALTLNEKAHLYVYESEDSTTLNVSHFQMNVDYDNYDYGSSYYYRNYIPTMKNYRPIVADNVTVKMILRTGKWNFLSLPFDCKVGDIEKEDGVSWVVRKYSGANRASGEGKTWLTLTDNDTIKAGEGFILQCDRDYYSSGSYPTFTFHAIDNANKNNIFTTENVSLPLAEYTSQSAANRSWNLIGNPYPAYFNTRRIEEEAIVTVWNGYNYDVYSTLDDTYMLRPFEAYFVQRPINVQTLTHPALFRFDTPEDHYSEDDDGYAKERKAQMASTRKVYNFMLTGEEMSDRARIVVNPEAQEGYEVGRDAAKFASLNADAPQLFVNRNGNSLAIDESPLESGKAKLGISSVKSSEYTISLSAINSSERVMLTDNVTGTTTDLTTSDYTFTAQPGTNASRFTVSFGTVDGIVDVNDNDNVNVNDNDNTGVYDLTGRRMAKTVKGLNIVNHRKIIVK